MSIGFDLFLNEENPLNMLNENMSVSSASFNSDSSVLSEWYSFSDFGIATSQSTCFVYFLHHVSEPRLKIGKANDVFTRAQQLKQTDFDFLKSFCFQVPNQTYALNLERALHRLFVNQRIDPDTISLKKEDGRSEWFSSSIICSVEELKSVVCREFDAFFRQGESFLSLLEDKLYSIDRIKKLKLLKKTFAFFDRNNERWFHTRQARLEKSDRYLAYVQKKYPRSDLSSDFFSPPVHSPYNAKYVQILKDLSLFFNLDFEKIRERETRDQHLLEVLGPIGVQKWTGKFPKSKWEQKRNKRVYIPANYRR